MIPEIGLLSLILAFCLSALLGVLPMAGSFLKHKTWMIQAKYLTIGFFFFTVLAFCSLLLSFLLDDFSVSYVANNSNSLLPSYYKFSAVWGGHEGSLLLWCIILAGWMLALAINPQKIPLLLHARTLSILGLISAGFILFIIFTSNPFTRLLPFPPTDGGDLNPLLQDFGLIIHPPLLYMGYVGFSVAYAFAVASLLDKQDTCSWAQLVRPWTISAWCFLTLGIALGSWWAYYELGWGGWWFWDPVENASLIPWLIGTALIHSLAVTEKRKLFSNWTLLLAILTFSMSLLGTFLVRSGILTSVHSFSNDPERGLYILIYLTFVTGSALLLFALRAPTNKKISSISWLSRETLLLLNNVLLTASAATILFGTLFPLAVEALDLGMISVGPPYFNMVFTPIAYLLAGCLGVGVLLQWKRGKPKLILQKIIVPIIACCTCGAILILTLDITMTVISGLGLILGLWIISVILYDIKEKIRHDISIAQLKKLGRSYYGMHTAHFGLAILLIGISLGSENNLQHDLRMRPGEKLIIGNYEFEFRGTSKRNGPNYLSDYATLVVFKNKEYLSMMHPEKRFFPVTGLMMTEVAISPGFFHDLYVALGEPLDDDLNSWSVRIQIKPFVRWIWAGAIFMALGGFFSVTDKRRYRRRKSMALSDNKSLENDLDPFCDNKSSQYRTDS